ncbi:MAG: glycoside hydrolase family 3 C-terminal domain-containing protein [Spirochaetales bacterium]|nr:glycoside hydrolase family 3 C-terminal domain-containing protein [Spirochaetales bacterium]
MPAKHNAQFIYKDPTRSIDERVDDLVSHMTIEEKTTQLLHISRAIPRLDIPEYDWWNECLHGVARAGKATVFPQAIGMAATFDKELIYRVATAISDEARAKYNAAQKIGNNLRYRGLTFWSPNINIFRDPRWGRGQETYGEDPYLTATLGTAFIKGLQGEHPVYLKVAACAKHFAVHSGPEKLRHQFNARVNLKDLNETYLPAFKALVDAGVEIVMGAFNRVNGEPCCGNKFLLIETLRKKWNFKGHVVSDCWGIADFHLHHNVTSTPEESIAMALSSGCDLNCGCIYDQTYLLNAIKKGLITEKQLDTALKNIFRTRFKLGMFDPPELVPYSSLGDEVVECPKHRELAYEAAVKSIVLLKNRNNILPLKKDLKNIYVFGNNATDIELLLGNYNGHSGRMVSILEGILEKAGTGISVRYHRVNKEVTIENVTHGYVDEPTKADVFIAVMGITPQDEGEEGVDAGGTSGEGDRKHIDLPEYQVCFINDLVKTGIPVIVILTAGSPLVVTKILDTVEALLYVWYPGEEGGNAVADILFGNVSPSGKLPITFPESIEQVPDFTDYSMKNRTYRYIKEEPLFPFGFGLGYTSFVYSPPLLSKDHITKGETVSVEVTITNTGDCGSDEVIQLYISHDNAFIETPRYALKGFQRIHLKAKESRNVRFTVSPEDMQIINEKGDAVLESGIITLTIGGSSPGNRSKTLGAPPSVSIDFEVMEK